MLQNNHLQYIYPRVRGPHLLRCTEPNLPINGNRPSDDNSQSDESSYNCTQVVSDRLFITLQVNKLETSVGGQFPAQAGLDSYSDRARNFAQEIIVLIVK